MEEITDEQFKVTVIELLNTITRKLESIESSLNNEESFQEE